MPRPKKPSPLNLPASVKVPDCRVEKAKEEEPVLKFLLSIPVIAPVVVPRLEAVSFVLNSSRDPVEVALVALSKETRSAIPRVKLEASSLY